MLRYIAFFLLLVFCNFSHAADSKLLRQPNSSASHITFVHGGDIYVVPIEGGTARKITSSEGIELFPRFSPDGKTIAFAGEYDGSQQIYTIPSMGGEAKKLTYNNDFGSYSERMGPNKIVMHWTPDGKNIVFRSRQENWHIMEGKIFEIPAEGGTAKAKPLPTSGFAYLSADGSKIAYNRVYRQFRTWKRYKGGQADNIWVYDFNSKKLDQITNNDAQNNIPMWAGNKIYYISDRNGVMNLYCYDLSAKTEKQVTDYKEFDVKFPSLGPHHIAYENGGFIYLLDLKTDQSRKVEIEVHEDFPWARDTYLNVKEKIGGMELGPDGARAIVSARGDLFTVPAKKGNIRTLKNTSDAHERNAVWSPDGKLIAYVSDKDGKDEIYVCKPDGSEETKLTDNNESYRYELEWSPDSKYILSSDKSMKLYYIDVASKKQTQIAKSKHWEIRDFSWAPDSRWIAYTDQVNSNIEGVYIYSLESGKSQLVTTKYFNSSHPVWTPGGNYLFFVSNRTYNASVDPHEWNFQYKDMGTVYGIVLRKDMKSPFQFESDEVVPASEKKEEKKDEKKDVAVTVDFDNIDNRIFEMPGAAGNYSNLSPTKDHKLYFTRSQTGSPAKSYVYDFVNKEEKEIGDFGNFEISADGKKILVAKGGDYYITDLSSKVDLKDAKLDLSDLKVKVNRRQEWKQIYYETWRQMRDFFYDPNMHGYDWEKIRKRYEQFLPHVDHRDDLTYILGEMIAELNVGHAYVGGGDMPKAEKIGIGLLGCEYEVSGGKFKIAKIYEGRNWEEKTRSPLTEPGIDIKPGEYLVEIDGKEINETYAPDMALENKAGKYVRIGVNSKASKEGARYFDVKTIADDKGLKYSDWVESRRRIVEEKTNGRVGYIHIPDMGLGNGLTEFVKYFYSQLDKEALIIDDRYNGGGNVSPMIIERLRREIGLAQSIRNQEIPSAKPDATFTGPYVCLINEMSMSDGDLFPYQFRHYKLGKLIGKRTWGGVIGIRGSLPFLDGGYLNRPEFANFGPDGTWVLEGTGISPDIEVDNKPDRVMAGYDDQLEKGIEVILEEIKTNKKLRQPKVPAYPDKNPLD